MKDFALRLQYRAMLWVMPGAVSLWDPPPIPMEALYAALLAIIGIFLLQRDEAKRAA